MENFWKKTAAGLLALLIVAGASPVAPVTKTAQKAVITASAEETLSLQQDGDKWYVNMPKSGTSTLTLNDDSITSFKVFDDGGKGSNYSDYCDGTLVLTAPEGYILRLSGSVKTERRIDNLTVYDGEGLGGNKLIDAAGSYYYGDRNSIPTIISTDQSMTLYFSSNDNYNYEGLDLTVTLVNLNTEYNVDIYTTTGGTVAPSKSTAKLNETVTLTATPDEGYLLCDLSIIDAYNNPVNVEWNDLTNTATFTMPATEVVITPTFSNAPFITMPTSGSKEVIIPSGFQSFKVYDAGGKDGNYSNECKSSLVLTAPEGFVLQLSGNIATEARVDGLTVHDGSSTSDTQLLYDVSSTSNGAETAITTVVSSGQSMLLYFESNLYNTYPGLDLTVSVIPESTKFPITVNSTTGGSVEASATQAKPYDTVNLTSTPESGYLLKGLNITDASEYNVPVEGGWYTNNCATFIMPGSAVNVTPTFTNELSADGGLYINMPKTGTKTATIPEGVESFKVYDDGGKDGAYSNECEGYLLLTAPEGYVFQLSGSIKTEFWDYLYVYDGDNNNAATLINRKSSSTDGSETTVGPVVSSGQSILLYFHTDSLDIYSGLDLVVSVIPDSTKYLITVNQTAGGNVEASATQAKPYDTVNLTSTPESGYLLKELSITDASENNVSVEGGWYTNNCASFIMPGSAVTVKPTFTNELSAEGGLYINMPKTGTQTATIPANVESFKIYDDGGKDGKYSYYCDGNLILTAPEGYVLKLSGSILTQYAKGDELSVYDGDNTDAPKLLNAVRSSDVETVTSISTVVSSGRNMMLHFNSDGTWVYDGLDLTVTLVKSSAEFAINGLDDITGGTIEAAVNGSNVTTAKVNDDVSITISPKSGYLLSSLSVTDGDGRSLDISDILWNNDVGTFSFTMPDSDVTITPTFINTPDLYYKIPVFGSQEVTIPSGVHSFKVYDDGGYYNNYSYNCNGTLILTAPTGYVLQLSGNITTDNGFDLLTVYDGDGISTKLIDKAYSSSANTETAITTVTSSGQSMRIFFTSNDHYNYSGLDLTVTLVPITYTVTWIDGNGNTLKTEQVAYGETPVYTGNTPTKAATAQYSYTFTGWDTTPAEVTGNATYTAQFSQTVNKYTVTWKNGDTILETDENAEYGTTPEYNGEIPTKPMDNDYTYTFSGWSPEISSVEGDIEYTAQFTATERTDKCGDKAYWEFDSESGKLTISGTGAMYNYDYDNTTDTVNSPWFAYKDNITSVIIGDGITSIGNRAFKGCESLTSVKMSKNVTSIGQSAFASCTGLTSIKIPDSVTSIGDFAFYNCTSLTSIVIPAKVTNIGADAFYNCTGITDVYCYAAPANLTWNDGDCDDFKSGKETVCHVPAEHIDDYNAKFGTGSDYPVNVRFVGDLVDMGLGEHLYGHSITLDGSIGVNFFVELTDELLTSETAEMIFTIPNGSKTDTQAFLVKDVIADDNNKVVIGSKTYYKFRCSVSAKDMASTITAQLVDGESKGKEYTYSVKDYAEYILEHNEVDEYANAAPLVKAMLNYGAASQTYFGIEGTAANAALTDEEKALGEVSIPDTFKFDEANADLPEGVTFEGATLSLKSETTLSLYFKGLADGTEFICGDKNIETVKNGEYVVARIRGIKANELENDFTVKFGESSETYNVTYNVMTYCYNVLNDDTVDDNLKNVCKALYKYAQAAKTYSE